MRPRWSRPTARPSACTAFAKGAKAAGFKVIIAGAGGARPPAGHDRAAHRRRRCWACRLKSKALYGMDSLLSIVQMPGGIPVGHPGDRRRRARRTPAFWPPRSRRLPRRPWPSRLAAYRAPPDRQRRRDRSKTRRPLPKLPLPPGSTDRDPGRRAAQPDAGPGRRRGWASTWRSWNPSDQCPPAAWPPPHRGRGL